jgi:hypothetical protein
MNRVEAIEMVRIHGSFLEKLSDEQKRDPEIILEALDNTTSLGDVVCHIPRDVLKNNEAVAKRLIEIAIEDLENPEHDLMVIFGGVASESLVFRRFILSYLIKNKTLSSY